LIVVSECFFTALLAFLFDKQLWNVSIVVTPGAKLTKHREINLWQRYNIWKVYDRFTIKH